MARLLLAVGKLVCDEVLRLPVPLVRGDQTHITRLRCVGGAPANVTAWARTVGVACRLAGWAGADPIADELLSGLAARGVELTVLRRGRTPAATVLVEPDGERTLLVDPGTAAALTPADVDPAWLDGAAAVHLDGYDLLPGRFPGVLAAVADLAHARGLPVSVDVAAAGRIRAHGQAPYRELLARLAADVLFCNRAEATVLGPVSAPLVVVHRASEPTVVLDTGGRREYPVAPVPVIDATGAGDAFAAGFLSARLSGAAADEAVAVAHTLASQAVGVRGGQPPPVGSGADRPTPS